jgi:hypothetical protein
MAEKATLYEVEDDGETLVLLDGLSAVSSHRTD